MACVPRASVLGPGDVSLHKTDKTSGHPELPSGEGLLAKQAGDLVCVVGVRDMGKGPTGEWQGCGAGLRRRPFAYMTHLILTDGSEEGESTFYTWGN